MVKINFWIFYEEKNERSVERRNSYHGMSMGSLSITPKKNRIGIPVGFTIEIPFYNENSNTNNALELYLKSIDKSDYPAAIVLETVQAEGGINVASIEWLQKIQSIASHYGILLIADEVQVGVGRTGKFFSFERAEMSPDIVCISKSISGYGIPLSLLLIKPHLDIWDAGEHTGTFRGVNLAFITAKEALVQYWHNENFTAKIQNLSEILEQNLKRIAKDKNFLSCGIGLIYGLNVKDAEYAARVRQRAFDQGLIFETCGPTRSVIKIIPPLIITKEELMQGLEILEKSF